MGPTVKIGRKILLAQAFPSRPGNNNVHGLSYAKHPWTTRSQCQAAIKEHRKGPESKTRVLPLSTTIYRSQPCAIPKVHLVIFWRYLATYGDQEWGDVGSNKGSMLVMPFNTWNQGGPEPNGYKLAAEYSHAMCPRRAAKPNPDLVQALGHRAHAVGPAWRQCLVPEIVEQPMAR